MKLAIGEFSLYIVKRDSTFFGTDLGSLDLMGRTSLEWLLKLDDSAIVVNDVDVENLSYSIVLYSDTPLVTYDDLCKATEIMENRNVSNAILPCGYILTENCSKLVEIPLESSNFIRLTDAESYEKILCSLRTRINHEYMQSGVFIEDCASVYIDDTVEIGKGTVIKNNNRIKGSTVVGERVVFEPNNNVTNTIIGDEVKLNSVVSVDAQIGEKTTLGPYVYLRPGAKIGTGCKVGDFVEIKNSTICDGAKVPHLAYVGDADVGRRVNVGCGVIFANYDGKKKHRTKVGDDSFIGSNTTLIAPIEVGEGAFIAAGATVARSVPGGAFVIARASETIKEGRAEKYLKKD